MTVNKFVRTVLKMVELAVSSVDLEIRNEDKISSPLISQKQVFMIVIFSK